MKKSLMRSLLFQTYLALFFCGSVCANGRTDNKSDELLATPITGIVKGVNGQPLGDVSVGIKGTSKGTITDKDGRFSIELTGKESVLIFSLVGYKSLEVNVSNKNSVEISLEDEIKYLSDVVVVGYGNRKKVNYTGAVSTVGTKEIVEAPVANISNALTGRLSGLIAVQRNGEPGRDGSNLLIRGVSTTGDNSPLVVIDGIPRGDFSQ
ncbi:MAG: carboxypeptidase-like regulatory domain-containing protein, partial [Bacteroidota bacterium]